MWRWDKQKKDQKEGKQREQFEMCKLRHIKVYTQKEEKMYNEKSSKKRENEWVRPFCAVFVIKKKFKLENEICVRQLMLNSLNKTRAVVQNSFGIH